MSNALIFRRLFVTNVANGLHGILLRLALFILISGMTVAFSLSMMALRAPHLIGPLSLGEAMLCIWKGMLPFVEGLGEQFQFPMAWFALIVSISYAVLDYPTRDLAGMGARLIAKGGSRWCWWLAMCCWVMLVALTCWIATIIIAFLITICSTGLLSWEVRPDIALALDAAHNDATHYISHTDGVYSAPVRPGDARDILFDAFPAAIGGVIVLVSILIIQTVVSFVTYPVMGMVSTVTLLFFSAYYSNPWLIGNYLMFARSEEFMRAGMDPLKGAIMAALITVIAVVAGGFWFSRKDILPTDGAEQ